PDGRVKVGNNTYSPDTEMISLWDINDEIAEQLLALKNLRSITFYRINDISSVKKLAPLESLSEITLYECYDLNDISAINSLNNLKKVEVSCSDPTQISKLGKYDDLTVVLQIKDITPQTISVLASCGNLTGVKQKGGYDDRLSNSQVELLTTLTQLKKLYIDTTADKLTDLNCMSSLNDLKELEVHLSRYYDSPKQDISTVMSMSGLEYLDISGHFDFPTNIGSLKKLKHLRITSSVDDHDDFSAIGLLTDLEYLEFDANYKDVDYSFLSGLKNLKSLTIDGTSANKLTPLTSLTNLESLSLTGALKRDYNDGIDLLKPLAQLKNLKSVDIYISGSSGDTNSNGWTSRFYAPLGEIKSLTSLTITDTGMADVDLSFISGLGNWFSDLRFRNMNITDLSFLSGKSVLNLEFYDTKIPTDITPILEMDWITCFITRNSGFSDEDINRIKEKFPNCYFMT
ncbi:MAG: hypothetical protein IK093_15210, partial [Ruminiclostridium sp.]|nr:hypothetical protein [Ruminiclostridium sp.]